MKRIGVIACDMIKRELDPILNASDDIVEVIYLEAALHVYPKKMKERVKAEIEALAGRVDVIFLGFGYCQSLQGIEAEVDARVVMPQVDDCISMLLTPKRYAEEVRKEVGTWFMSPGWAEVGADMVIKELHLDRATRYGRDPLEMAKRLFTHYRRGLFIDTGVGNDEHFLAKAGQFCRDFNLNLERTRGTLEILETTLAKCRNGH